MKTVFLIERQEVSLPWYIGARVKRKYAADGFGWHWTHVLQDAICFARKEDAEAAWEIIKHHVGHGANSSEPAFISAHIFEE